MQENHYCPFGLNQIGDWYATTAPENKYQYNGKELNEELGLNWNNYGARYYDPAIARWNAVDPLAEKYRSNSPFHYVLNNPVQLIDPFGMDAWMPNPNTSLWGDRDEKQSDVLDSKKWIFSSGQYHKDLTVFRVEEAPQGEGALDPESFDFKKEKVVDWQTAKLKDLRVILEEYRRSPITGLPVIYRYAEYDFAMKVGVPTILRNGTKISANRAARQAAFAANYSAIELGLFAARNPGVKSAWFSNDAGLAVRTLYGGLMETNVSTSFKTFGKRFSAIPGARVSVYSNDARSVQKWKSAIYKTGWEQFTDWITKIFD